MNLRMTKKQLALPLIALGLMSMNSFATEAERDAKALEATKITLTQAIDAALKKVEGKAYDASFEDDSLEPMYEVEVLKDGKSFQVYVDGVTGEVIRSREDLDD